MQWQTVFMQRDQQFHNSCRWSCCRCSAVEAHSLQVSWHSLPMDHCTAHTHMHKHTHTHTHWKLSAWTIPHYTVSFPQSRQSGGIWANPKAKWISWRNQVNLGSVVGLLQKSVCPCCCCWSAVPWPGWWSSTHRLWKVMALSGSQWKDPDIADGSSDDKCLPALFLCDCKPDRTHSMYDYILMHICHRLTFWEIFKG